MLHFELQNPKDTIRMSESKFIEGKLIEFKAKDGSTLNGFLTGPTKSKKCIIYVHGMTGNFYGSNLQFHIAKEISSSGYSLFAINTRGHDAVAVIKRIKGSSRDRFVAGTDLEKFEDSLLDIDAAIMAMKNLKFSEIILAGHSTGCQKVAYYQYKKKSKEVKGIILLAPADDYAIQKKVLGKRFDQTVAFSRKMAKDGRGNEPNPKIPSHFSPNRFLSLTDPRRPESRIFNYDGDLKEFSNINIPICAVFGNKEEYAVKPVLQYLKILKSKTSSMSFTGVIVDGAGHSFRRQETMLSVFIKIWLENKSKKIQTYEILELNKKFPLTMLGYS